MSVDLTKFQKQLCNLLQDGLPVCRRPFAEIAKVLNCDETTVLQQARLLKEMGIVRRFRALIDYRALGRISTLVAAHIPEDSFDDVTEAVNSLEGVSHNYRRDHFYNLWFTLQMQTISRIESVLTDLSARFGTEFHSLPVERAFKLDVRFDAELLVMRSGVAGPTADNRRERDEPVELNDVRKLILSRLQEDLEFVAEPFDFFSDRETNGKDIHGIIKELVDTGLIRRIAAVLDHRRLGFVCNVLFVCEVPRDRILEAGRRLACMQTVSHCYQRETFESWPYNLFAMMHACSERQIQHDIGEFVKAERAKKFELLQTVAELKKQPVRYNL